MARKPASAMEEGALTKGQLRKLNALRKSVGPEIGEQAFAAWLKKQPEAEDAGPDKNAELIAKTLWVLVEKKQLNIQRGGYLVRRGRGRIIVEPARAD